MSIRVRFACGHAAIVSDPSGAPPQCAECGDTTIRRVNARPPRFTGACSGPYATSCAVEPREVQLAVKGPLTLKPQE